MLRYAKQKEQRTGRSPPKRGTVFQGAVSVCLSSRRPESSQSLKNQSLFVDGMADINDCGSNRGNCLCDLIIRSTSLAATAHHDKKIASITNEGDWIGDARVESADTPLLLFISRSCRQEL